MCERSNRCDTAVSTNAERDTRARRREERATRLSAERYFCLVLCRHAESYSARGARRARKSGTSLFVQHKHECCFGAAARHKQKREYDKHAEAISACLASGTRYLKDVVC